MITDTSIPADLQPYLEQIDAMDPVDDVPGPVVDNSATSRGEALSAVTVDALPPEDRSAIFAQLHGYSPEQRAARESQLVIAAMKAKVRRNRALTGLGEEALPYHKAQAEVARQVYEIDRKIKVLETELEAVADYTTVTDPRTGSRTAQSVMRVTGTRRAAYENQILDLQRHRRVYVADDGSDGPEAAREIAKARLESAKLLQQRDQERAEVAEVRRLADEINRQRRITAKAESLARMQRNELK